MNNHVYYGGDKCVACGANLWEAESGQCPADPPKLQLRSSVADEWDNSIVDIGFFVVIGAIVLSLLLL